ncbi:MAG: VCBS repeat-containing protein [Prevotellaceae bacterium]|jgi:hypothetical protein|nr:VCBS repeat-containing protein [Prevotellaceae bacterium]
MPDVNNCGRSIQYDVSNDHDVFVNIANRNSTTGNTATLIKSIPDVDMGNGYFIKDGKTVTADINQDGHLDVIVLAALSHTSFGIIVWDTQTETLIAKTTSITNNKYFGVPCIGNIDIDSNLEILLMSVQENFSSQNGKIEGFRYNGTNTLQKVYYIITNDASVQTGITLFDFNNDGIAEIVYRDQENLRVMQAQPNSSGVGTFVNLSTFPATSGTSCEYHIIADVDNDGETELLTIGGDAYVSLPAKGKLRIYKSNGSPWAAARKVWNQYAYNSVNVNEDLTIPQYYFNPATKFAGQDQTLGTNDDIQPFNCFLQQQTYLVAP